MKRHGGFLLVLVLSLAFAICWASLNSTSPGPNGPGALASTAPKEARRGLSEAQVLSRLNDLRADIGLPPCEMRDVTFFRNVNLAAPGCPPAFVHAVRGRDTHASLLKSNGAVLSFAYSASTRRFRGETTIERDALSGRQKKELTAKARRLVRLWLTEDVRGQLGPPHVVRYRQYGALFWEAVFDRVSHGYPHVDEYCWVKWCRSNDTLVMFLRHVFNPVAPPPDKLIPPVQARKAAVQLLREATPRLLKIERIPADLSVRFTPAEERMVYARPNGNLFGSPPPPGGARLVYAVRIVSLGADQRAQEHIGDGYPFPAWVLVDAGDGHLVGVKARSLFRNERP